MGKIADSYLTVHPWRIVEDSFHPDRSEVSESIFSLANEHMGFRGNFEEGYSGKSLQGFYLNGVFEKAPVEHPVIYPGIATSLNFMVNSPNPFYTRIRCNGELLDLNHSRFRDFRRVLDLRTSTLTRSFVWQPGDQNEIQITFTRWFNMAIPELARQEISFQSASDAVLELELGVDHGILHMNTGGHGYWNLLRHQGAGSTGFTLGKTRQTNHFVLNALHIQGLEGQWENSESCCWYQGTLALQAGIPSTVSRQVACVVMTSCKESADAVWDRGLPKAEALIQRDPAEDRLRHLAYWEDVWQTQDIQIDGDPEQQQGIRYCILQLHQTYHGVNPAHNVGAKGLTGEAYHGATFWDTETYCLPFYIFNNPGAARTLLEYRYRTLPQALDWARQQDAEGAFYPMATIDGTEGCGVWWHGNLEIHVSAAVAYGIWNYVKLTGDTGFLFEMGLEMWIQICRFFASRGNWGVDGSYGYYGVMGPDEFHTFVNHNCYTNVMARKCFQWCLEGLKTFRQTDPSACESLMSRLNVLESEPADWEAKADAMKILLDHETGIYEQHAGYFDLPRLDIHSIPVEDFPLYDHWSLPRIYRYDMIKQPDVLLLFLFFGSEYSLETKRVNYDYYEPRCIHESSLSPSVHSILAAELGNLEEAREFSHFATRLDLDNYNRNTGAGLHTTSIAGAWMNLIYGYGGLRSDGPVITLFPRCPMGWKKLTFRLWIKQSLLEVSVDESAASLHLVKGPAVDVKVYGELLTITETTCRRPTQEAKAEPSKMAGSRD